MCNSASNIVWSHIDIRHICRRYQIHVFEKLLWKNGSAGKKKKRLTQNKSVPTFITRTFHQAKILSGKSGSSVDVSNVRVAIFTTIPIKLA